MPVLRTHRSFKAFLTCTAMLPCVIAPHYAYAQVEEATGSADPARVGIELMNRDVFEDVSPTVEVRDAILTGAPEGAESIVFTLNNLLIDGVSAYTSDDLDPLYRDLLGTEVTLAQIYGLANTLTVKYRNDGYILTQVVVPPQTIEGGTVRLQIVEGVLDKVNIQGEDDDVHVKQVRKYAETLRESGTLNAKELERYVLLINDLPGVTARSILSRSENTPGASDITVIIEEDPYEASVSFDNYGTRFLGPYRATFTNTFNNTFGLYDRITGQFVIGGDQDNIDELLYGSIIYEQPLSRFGSKIRFNASISATDPGADLDQFDVRGKSKYWGVTVSHPFIRSRATNLTGYATFDWRDVDSKNNLQPLSTEDRIRSIRLGTTAQFQDQIIGFAANQIDFKVSKGVDFFGASDRGDAQLTRAAGNPDYTKAELSIQRLQRLMPNWNLLIAGAGQISATPLLSSEEFGVGGQSFGRGYDSSEIVGEDGIAGMVELQINKPVPIKYIHNYQLYSFFDIGRVWNQDATTSAAERESIASTGIGFRADLTEKTRAEFSVALPLTRHVDVTNDRDPRYSFRLAHEF